MSITASSSLSLSSVSRFHEIAPGIGAGNPLPAGWRSLADLDPIVLVGVTGAGKSTALSALDARGIAYTLLPDRRVVTDQVIIPRYADGDVRDRVQRFAITQRFTRDVAGGMAAVLAGLSAAPALQQRPLVFDGLRGEAEVRHAAAVMPRARFLVLTAPDMVRLMRLLGRGDAFDRVVLASSNGGSGEGFALDGADGILAPAEQARLSAEVNAGRLNADDVRAKFTIIAAERRNYDPDRAVDALMELAPERTLVVDTTRSGPAEVGEALARLLPEVPHAAAAAA